MLISQSGSSYQLTEITLDAGHARDIIHLLLDIHGVLGLLCHHDAEPELTSQASELLRYTGSNYTPATLIGALDEVINQLTWTMRDAIMSLSPPASQQTSDPGSF